MFRIQTKPQIQIEFDIEFVTNAKTQESFNFDLPNTLTALDAIVKKCVKNPNMRKKDVYDKFINSKIYN